MYELIVPESGILNSGGMASLTVCDK